MRLVIALGGNALLRRGEAPGAAAQRDNVRRAAAALAPLAAQHELVITHGNGPQVGLLALERGPGSRGGHYPLDVLDAETEGMIGYLVQQELDNVLPPPRRAAALITQVEVAADDAAFAAPDKPIGPVYAEAEAHELAARHGWSLIADGDGWRRAVASPRPLRIVELGVIAHLLEAGVVVICAGGGGVPVVQQASGALLGVEAVVDKDRASALLARELGADALLLLTDVDALYERWPADAARAWAEVASALLRSRDFAAGSMAPKVGAACDFVDAGGSFAAIGALGDAAALLAGSAGTRVLPGAAVTRWRE